MGPALSSIDEAVAALERGGVIVIPTDTVYGLAAAADHPEAIARVFSLKGRSTEKAIQLLVDDVALLDRYGRPSSRARTLADKYWPGPLTLVVRATSEAPTAVVHRGTIGLRFPDHRTALGVIARVGALAASSANATSQPTPEHIAAIRTLFGDAVDVYIDAGRIAGRASTVVDMTLERPVVLREGAIPAEEIMHALGFGFESG